jgi:hypothetical protein
VLNAPESFEPELARLPVATVHRSLRTARVVRFSLAFVTRQIEVDALVPQLSARAIGDAAIWFSYPKGTSKKFKCDFNRDTGWSALNAAGFDCVRSIAIDEDWTGLRFRRKEYLTSRRVRTSPSGDRSPTRHQTVQAALPQPCLPPHG